jgi:hypothetical protein
MPALGPFTGMAPCVRCVCSYPTSRRQLPAVGAVPSMERHTEALLPTRVRVSLRVASFGRTRIAPYNHCPRRSMGVPPRTIFKSTFDLLEDFAEIDPPVLRWDSLLFLLILLLNQVHGRRCESFLVGCACICLRHFQRFPPENRLSLVNCRPVVFCDCSARLSQAIRGAVWQPSLIAPLTKFVSYA